jgi:hypothetical protein
MESPDDALHGVGGKSVRDLTALTASAQTLGFPMQVPTLSSVSFALDLFALTAGDWLMSKAIWAG